MQSTIEVGFKNSETTAIILIKFYFTAMIYPQAINILTKKVDTSSLFVMENNAYRDILLRVGLVGISVRFRKYNSKTQFGSRSCDVF